MTASERPLLLAASLAYLVVVLAIGVWAARRTRNARDFFIAGQGVGLVVAALATMSAAFSGFVFLGGPGLTYRMGIVSLFIVAPVGFTSGLLCWVVGKRLRLLAEAREVFTVPDAIACRYRSRAAAGLAAVAVALGTVGYLGAQFLALGVLLQSMLGLQGLAPAVAVGVAVVLAYSVAGGMLAGVYTDLFQGALMTVAALAVFALAVRVPGGWSAITASIADAEAFGPRFLDPLGGGTAFTAFGFFFVFGVGVLGQPQMLHKFYMLRDPRQLRWFPAVLGGSQAACILIWVGIGLAVPALVAQGRLAPLERPDDAAAAFLLGFAPDALAGLVLAAVLAAIMSTADSFVNIGSAALVRDLPRALRRPVRDELLWGRIVTVGLAVAAASLALAYGDLVALLGTFAFGTFAAALAPALAVGLNWTRVTARAACVSIVTGTVLNVTLELLRRTDAFPFAAGVLPAAVALADSFAALFLATWWTAPPRGEAAPDETVRAVMEA